MRICSLLPGATEIAYLLDLGDQIVGVTHECDYPPDAQYKPVVVRSVIDPQAACPARRSTQSRGAAAGGKRPLHDRRGKVSEASPDVF